MLDPGDLVAVEDPVYLGARQTLDAHGAELLGVPVDGGGLCVDVLADRLAGGARPRLVYVVPHHQNPSGATLTGERRAELAALAGHYGFVILEDDPYRALGTDGPPLPPIGMLAPDRTITVGSASKIVAPGLRIGWVPRRPGGVRRSSLAKQSVDLHTAVLPQLVAADLLADDAFLTAASRGAAAAAPAQGRGALGGDP